MKIVGTGVQEIRIKDEHGIYRIIYVAKYLNTLFVLHAFQKKTQRTIQSDIDLAKQRLKAVMQKVKR